MEGVRPLIAVLTPISHIRGVREILSSVGDLANFPDSNPSEFGNVLARCDAIFVNPNKQKYFIGKSFLDRAKNLKVIATASTGTNHIDLGLATKRGILVQSLKEDFSLIEGISSTAEHALGLAIAASRNLVSASISVSRGEWDYEPFIGRQLSDLTVGVVGLGRLGRKFAGYMNAISGRVLYFDPYVKSSEIADRCSDITELFRKSDIVSLHVHVSEETRELVNSNVLSFARPELLLVNTSRGEIVEENALVDFLRLNPSSKYATDVLPDETFSREKSAILALSKKTSQVLITPHIGGMTREAQRMAYSAAAEKLVNTLRELSHR